MSPSAPFYSNTDTQAPTLSHPHTHNLMQQQEVSTKVQPWVSIDIAPPLLAPFPQHTTHTHIHTHSHPPERSLRGQGDYQGGVGQKKGDNYHIIQTIKETFREQQLTVLCVLSVRLTFSWTHLWSVVLVPGVCMHGTCVAVCPIITLFSESECSRFYWPGGIASSGIWFAS